MQFFFPSTDDSMYFYGTCVHTKEQYANRSSACNGCNTCYKKFLYQVRVCARTRPDEGEANGLGNGEQRSTAGGRTPLRLAPFLRGEVPWAGWGCQHAQPGTVGCHPLVVSATPLPSFLPYSCVGIGLT